MTSSIDLYSKQQTDTLLAGKADSSALSGKQDTLVSGTNIKTINSTPLLGSGDITISGGSKVSLTDNTTYYTLSII